MLDELQEKLNTYAKRVNEVVSTFGIVLIAVPSATMIAVAFGLLLSNSGIGLIVFFISLALLIVWLRGNAE